MSLARAADSRVAGHIADGVKVDGKHHRAQTEPCGSQSRFNSGMTRADHGDVILTGKILHFDQIL